MLILFIILCAIVLLIVLTIVFFRIHNSLKSKVDTDTGIQENTYITINGIEQYFVHYNRNSNTTVIFLHGGPGQSEAHFLYINEKMDNNYNLVYYDQRGTGKTQIKNKSLQNDVTIEVLINDLKETINYVKNKYQSKYIILLGHSFGSILSIEFIKKYPKYVNGFIGMGQVVDFIKGEKIAYDYCFNIVKQSKNKKYIKKIKKLKDYPFSINIDNAIEMIGKFRFIQIKYKLAGYSKGNFKLFYIMRKNPLFSIKDILVLVLSLKCNKNIFYYLLNYNTYINFGYSNSFYMWN